MRWTERLPSGASMTIVARVRRYGGDRDWLSRSSRVDQLVRPAASPTRTAAPVTRPADRSASASLARSSG